MSSARGGGPVASSAPGGAGPSSAPGGAGPSSALGGTADRPGPWTERGLRIGGTAIGVLAGLITAAYEGFLSPLRWGDHRVPLAPVLALLINPLLVWFTFRVTGSRRLALLPGLAWCLVLVAAAVGTSEGDIMLAGNNWMGLVLMATGALSWAIAAAVLVIQPPPLSPVPGPPAAGPRSARRPG